jgi:AAHS family cis,cis-muconate transporter-like MFS transporter
MAPTDSSDKMDVSVKRIVIALFIAMVVDGIDLQMLALALPSIMKELNLSSVVGGSLGTWTMAGMGIGGILGGWLCDRKGRVKVFFWCLLTFTVFTAFIAFCQTYWQLTFCRVIAGCGIGACYGICMTMVSEFVPTKWRATTLGTMQAGWSLGYVVAGIMSAYIQTHYGWRALFLSSIVPGLISLLLLFGLKDAPSYQAARAEIAKAGKQVNEYAQLWANKPVRYTFIAWCFTAIALQFGYYGANIWLPSYLVKDLGVDLKSMGWFVAVTYGAMMLGKSAAGYLADRVGRRNVWCIAGIGSAIALPLTMYYATPVNVAFLLIFVGLLYGAPYGVNGAYMSESFPTSIRGTCLATAHNVGRLGAMAAPIMIGFVSSEYSITFGIGLLGIGFLICGVIPPILMREKIFDPKAVENSAAS